MRRLVARCVRSLARAPLVTSSVSAATAATPTAVACGAAPGTSAPSDCANTIAIAATDA